MYTTMIWLIGSEKTIKSRFEFESACDECYDKTVMATNLIATITALEAQAAANLFFLSDHLPDRFSQAVRRLMPPPMCGAYRCGSLIPSSALSVRLAKS
jgi:hypothetical protein